MQMNSSNILRKIALLSLVISIPYCVHSQNLEGINARADGMGSVYLRDDLGWTVGKPSMVADFPDQIQGSIYTTPIPDVGETYGNIIAIKSIGDYTRFGIIFNERIHMPYGFYKEGAFYLEGKHIPGGMWDPYINIPGFVLAAKFNDNVSLGISGFFENTSYGIHERHVFTYFPADGISPDDSTPVYWEHNKIDKKVINNVFIIDGRFKAGGLQIRPMFKYGFPTIKGNETGNYISQLEKSLQANPADSSATFEGLEEDITWSSPNTYLLKGGVFLWANNDNFEIDWGVWYEEISYQFAKDVRNDTVTLDAIGNRLYEGLARRREHESERRYRSVEYLIGISPNYSDNLFIKLEYDGGFGWFEAKDPDILADTSFFHMYHNFRAGLEKGIPDFWFLDNLYFRTGVVAYWTKEWRSIENGGFDGTVTSSENLPWGSFYWGSAFGRKQAKVTGGIGLQKGRGQLDLSVDFLKWQGGLISGAPAAMATISVDFGRRDKQ